GTLFVAEGDFIRKVAPDGIISTYAGTPLGLPDDGVPATEANISPIALALAPDGTLYVLGERRVRAIGTDGIIRTVAGTGDFDSTGARRPARAAVRERN